MIATIVNTFILIGLSPMGYFNSDIFVAAVQPVNRFFSAARSGPAPELECLVGMDSAVVSELYKVKCSEAWNISIKYDRATANSLAGDGYISEHDRRLRTLKFGIQGSGIKYNAHSLWRNWTGEVTNWVCSYFPIKSALIYDCLPENQAPSWWKEPLMGPAFPTGHKPAAKEMRRPGCNGGVCYCNTENYCNDRHKALKGLEDCPVEQPHAKWDKRCLEPGVESEAQALVSSGGPRGVGDIMMVTSWGLVTLTWSRSPG